MMRSALIIFLVNYCALLVAQNLQFSRNFEARKKNIPLEILNNHSSYFYVLRLNNVVHDITIERRAKPSAEIIAFTPLKLDSVNAGWFDYENLEHLFFEQDHKAFFVFEKTRNTKKTIYLKIIDTTGRSTGFIEVVSQEKDNATIDFEFNFKRTTNNNILIISSRHGVNGITRKVVTLFDVRLKKVVWTKKLPLEITATETSSAFECSNKNDLFYTKATSVITGYDSFYRDNVFYTLPVLKLDSVFVIKWQQTSEFPEKEYLNLQGMTSLRHVFILPTEKTVFISLHGMKVAHDGDSVELAVTNIKLSSDDLSSFFSHITYYTQRIKDQLTFYDNPQKEFYLKTHKFFRNYEAGETLYTLSERSEGYYFKEILIWKTNMETGAITNQKIIPRKIFFFKNRDRFKNIATVMESFFDDSLKLLVLESPFNFKKEPDQYVYKDFRKETRLWNSNIVSYALNKDGKLEKKLIFRNGDFDLIPLHYESNGQKDMVFYLNNNKYEKFAFLTR